MPLWARQYCGVWRDTLLDTSLAAPVISKTKAGFFLALCISRVMSIDLKLYYYFKHIHVTEKLEITKSHLFISGELVLNGF